MPLERPPPRCAYPKAKAKWWDVSILRLTDQRAHSPRSKTQHPGLVAAPIPIRTIRPIPCVKTENPKTNPNAMLSPKLINYTLKTQQEP